MSDFINEPMLEMYVFETVQLINKLEQLIMNGEKDGNFDDDIDEIFRIMHTIKGNSMMMIFDGISNIAHKLEDLFDFIRKSEDLEPNYAIITDLVLETIDFTKGELAKIESNEEVDGDSSDLTNRIFEYLESLKFMSSNSISDVGDTVEEVINDKNKISENQKFYISPSKKVEIDKSSGIIITEKSNYKTYEVFIKFETGCEMENVRAFSIVHNLKNVASDIYHLPKNIVEDENACQIISENGVRIAFKSMMILDDLNTYFSGIAFLEKFDIKETISSSFENFVNQYNNYNVDLEVESEDRVDEELDKGLDENKVGIFDELKQEDKVPIKSKKVKLNTKETTKEIVKDSSTQNNYISVGITRVDLLMDLIGELVVSESMVTKNPDLAGLELDSFEKASRQLRIIINELQDVVMSIRMVPLTLTFQKMIRLVRDMSRKIEKEVELVIIGENTEVDKKVIEKIGDPLMHIIRNSIDHGIETEARRIESGKNKKGTIILEARHSGGDVWITVKDDGAGLDCKKILEKAISKNLLEKPAEEYSDREVYSLIFKAGFSTKESVTEFSGRGVGLDVVVKNIEALGGTVIVDSNQGIGSEFAIRIPLTLAIVDGMMMKVGKSIFTVPITSIKESFSVKQKDVIRDPDGNEMIMVRGECLPVLRLHKRYKLDTKVKELENGILMMIESDNRSKLIFADQIIGEQQVVVKGLSKFMKKIDGVSGCALLGDGTISLIIDPGGLTV
ncbi:MAG: chemotaxis protein CheA [Acidaminobacteraceae bacterium]